LNWVSGAVTETGEHFFFDALCAIRQRLEEQGAMLDCYGASLNVFPSGMSRDMGRGVKAYKLTLGSEVGCKTLSASLTPDLTFSQQPLPRNGSSSMCG
jgi:hypothetical protein